MPEPGRPRKKRRVDDVEQELSVEEIDKARKDSRGQLQSRFESIFDKYGKDFTGFSDVVDFASNEVSENNGHLSCMKDEYDLGSRIHTITEPTGALRPSGYDSEDELGNEQSSPRRKEDKHRAQATLATPSQTPSAEVRSSMLQLQSSAGKDTSTSPLNEARTMPTAYPGGQQTGIVPAEVIQQLGQSIAEQLAKYLNPPARSEPEAPAPPADTKQESIWDAPPLPRPPSPPRTAIAAPTMSLSSMSQRQPGLERPVSPPGLRSTSMWVESPEPQRRKSKQTTRQSSTPNSNALPSPSQDSHVARQRDIPQVSTPSAVTVETHSKVHPTPQSRPQQSAPKEKPTATSPATAKASNTKPSFSHASWTDDEDHVLTEYIQDPNYDRKKLLEEAAPRLPHRSMPSIKAREWVLRSKLKPGLLFRGKPPDADLSLIYTPTKATSATDTKTRQRFGRWNNEDSPAAHHGEPWSADDIKRLARLRSDNPDLPLRSLSRHFPGRVEQGVRSCLNKWKSGTLDQFLRTHSVIEESSEPQSSPLLPASSMTAESSAPMTVSSPLAASQRGRKRKRARTVLGLESPTSTQEPSSTDLKPAMPPPKARPGRPRKVKAGSGLPNGVVNHSTEDDIARPLGKGIPDHTRRSINMSLRPPTMSHIGQLSNSITRPKMGDEVQSHNGRSSYSNAVVPSVEHVPEEEDSEDELAM